MRQVDAKELEHFSARRETALMDAALDQDGDRWKESDVSIPIPDGRSRGPGSETSIPLFSVPGLMHRSIVEIIKETWSSSDAPTFQYVPYRNYWSRGPSGHDERVYGELYTSDAFLEAHKLLQSQPPEDGCNLERIVCALMLYSDSTHLASFGDASLWPLYLYFGNQSKYERVCPSSGSCHHVAYIPKIHYISLFTIQLYCAKSHQYLSCQIHFMTIIYSLLAKDHPLKFSHIVDES